MGMMHDIQQLNETFNCRLQVQNTSNTGVVRVANTSHPVGHCILVAFGKKKYLTTRQGIPN